MSSPTYYYSESEYDYEQYVEDDDQAEFEEQEPYMTYDEEMEAFDELDNSIFEDDDSDSEY